MTSLYNPKDVLFHCVLEICALSVKVGIPTPITLETLCELFKRYEEPWRHYHNLSHIADGILKLNSVREHMSDPIVIFVAWIYHDVVYTPMSPTNERCSAELAQQHLRERQIPEEIVAQVSEIILATKSHRLPDTFPGELQDVGLVLDVDLSGIGDEREKFLEDGEHLRKEFGLSEGERSKSRAQFARDMLEHLPIFTTRFFEPLEEQARTNLTWCVEQARAA